MWFWMKSQVLCHVAAQFRWCLYSCSSRFCFFFYVQELDLLVEFVLYCGSYGVVASYLNAYVVGRQSC
jgi:hypothetical protein